MTKPTLTETQRTTAHYLHAADDILRAATRTAADHDLTYAELVLALAAAVGTLDAVLCDPSKPGEDFSAYTDTIREVSNLFAHNGLVPFSFAEHLATTVAQRMSEDATKQ